MSDRNYLDRYQKDFARRRLKQLLPDVSHAITPALNGDDNAIKEVLGELVGDMEAQADALEILYRNRQHEKLLQRVFAHAWSGNRHNWLMQTYIEEQEAFLRNLVKVAGTKSTGLPEQVTVWRGGSGPDVANGWSWTFDRQIACFFANYPANHGRINGFDNAVVLKATIPSSIILHLDNSRDEHEAVIPGGAPGAVLDDDSPA
jgi:hypothetical protein